MTAPDHYCPACGGEIFLRRQKLSQLTVTYQVCSLCGAREPAVEEDLETHVFRDILLPPDPEGVNTWLPRSLRHRRLQASSVPHGKTYKILGHDCGWMRVETRAGTPAPARETWIAPGGRLMLEALDEAKE